MSEQDRKNSNEYHYENYKNILKALNDGDEAEIRAICVREMDIIDQDNYIENDNEEFKDIIKELDGTSKIHLVRR